MHGLRSLATASSSAPTGAICCAQDALARERVERGGMLCANIDGFDLHGRIAFSAAQRDRLEELVRYSGLGVCSG